MRCCDVATRDYGYAKKTATATATLGYSYAITIWLQIRCHTCIEHEPTYASGALYGTATRVRKIVFGTN